MHLLPPPDKRELCITLIGMPGSGKSTVGHLLARHLQWALVDTDHLIEAPYGLPLQAVTNALGKEDFLDVEARIVSSVRASRAVLATGGSVVYREHAMRHLASLGPVVYLELPYDIIEERVALNPQRGLAIAPGQTLRDLYEERAALYARYAGLRVHAAGLNPQACALRVAGDLRKNGMLRA